MLKVVYFSTGLWLAGEYEKRNGVGVIKMPRYYHVMGEKHGFMSLPGNPKSVILSEYGFIYDLEQGSELWNLYFERLRAERAYMEDLLRAKDEGEDSGVSDESGVRAVSGGVQVEPAA